MDPDQQEIENKRNDQGRHECEVFGYSPGLLETEKTWKACKKNPGHENFIPYSEFRLEHLPKGLRNTATLKLVRSYGDRTVRVRVGYTSLGRPNGYAFAGARGSRIPHTGSGWIDDIMLSSGEALSGRINRMQTSPTETCVLLAHNDRPCPCRGCADNKSGLETKHQQMWYEVRVITACHVVYDKEEAQSTQIDLFYDDQSSESEGRMKTIWGFDVISKDSEADTCFLRCAAHDKDFIERSVPRRVGFGDAAFSETFMPFENNEICVIVSHPHGSWKRITVGTVDMGSTEPPGRINYNAHTCPGSSGAPVLWMFNFNSSGDFRILPTAVHSLGGYMTTLSQSTNLLNTIH